MKTRVPQKISLNRIVTVEPEVAIRDSLCGGPLDVISTLSLTNWREKKPVLLLYYTI